MANVEGTSRHLPSSSEHEDRPSTRALALSTQISEQDMSNNNEEPTQVLDEVIVRSSSANAFRRSSSPIEDTTVALETVSSRASRPIPQQKDDCGFTKEEIIAMLAEYRGGEVGLAGRSRTGLLGLLKFYEVSAVL
jgi:hypothetical protein